MLWLHTDVGSHWVLFARTNPLSISVVLLYCCDFGSPIDNFMGCSAHPLRSHHDSNCFCLEPSRRGGGWSDIWFDWHGFLKKLASHWYLNKATYCIHTPTPFAGRYRCRGSSLFAGLDLLTIVQAFEQPVAPWDFAATMGLTVASLASGFKGGEVTPLFFVGATLGNALAPVFNLPFPVLAAVGFVAVFAAVANTQIACTHDGHVII